MTHTAANTMQSGYEIVTKKIIKQLESGVARWRKPWSYLLRQKEYRGFNVFTTEHQSSPRKHDERKA